MQAVVATQSSNSLVIESLPQKINEIKDPIPNEHLIKAEHAIGIGPKDISMHKLEVHAFETKVP